MTLVNNDIKYRDGDETETMQPEENTESFKNLSERVMLAHCISTLILSVVFFIVIILL